MNTINAQALVGMLGLWPAVCLMALLTGDAGAQTDEHIEFEVSSIKPTASKMGGMRMGDGPGGGVRIVNASLKDLIMVAYGMQLYQIYGGPAWVDSARYDIVAKPEAETNRAEIPQMLRSLLADRFQLTVHRVTKELPVYELVVASQNGRLGPKLITSRPGACTLPDPSKPPPPPEPGKRAPLLCGQTMMSRKEFAGVSVPIQSMIPMLSRLLDRPVIDKTGLKAEFDITLQWTLDDGQGMQPPLDVPRLAPTDTDAPPIFTALQEQLGLKLKSQKGPVQTIMIDRAAEPSEN